jgi:pyridoxamine 5'-phosphate oxidase
VDTKLSGSEAELASKTSEKSPWTIFSTWFEEAQKAELNLPEAVSLATVDGEGMPNVRMVLMKDFGEAGFTFYTNLESQKGIELSHTPKAALCFHWKSIKKQVRVQGTVSLVSDAEADEYFSSRPKDSQIGAWASRQSRTLEGRFELETEVAKFAAKYAVKKVDRPPFWSGYRLRPLTFEFWQDQPFRLHDRQVYKRNDVVQGDWTRERLFP